MPLSQVSQSFGPHASNKQCGWDDKFLMLRSLMSLIKHARAVGEAKDEVGAGAVLCVGRAGCVRVSLVKSCAKRLWCACECGSDYT